MNMHNAPSGKTPFASGDSMTGSLSAGMAATMLAAVGDVAFILSPEGAVLDISVSDSDLAKHGFADWVGTPLIDTVTVESRVKIDDMLTEAVKPVGAPRWRQVNHVVAGGDVAVRYLMMALGDEGRLIAIGRDMRATAALQQRLLQSQQAIERDYIRLRQTETRYRLLFDVVSEPVLIVDADDRRISEANPAAYRLLDAAPGELAGVAIQTIVAAGQRDDLIAYLGAAEAADDLAPIALRLVDNRGDAKISARLFRQARKALFIVRIDAAGGATGGKPMDATLGEVIERMPDAFVLVGGDLNVLSANAAFLEMTQMPSMDRVVGARLDTWLGRPGIDVDLIIAQLREHGSVRNVASILRGAAGSKDSIELAGVSAPMGDGECYGFTIRDVGRRERSGNDGAGDVPRSVGQLTELVGRMSLKDIVRESTDLIERLCIEAALVYTSDNRASAAEILGVSRQSLYSKLHRHGLGNLMSSDV